MRSTLLTLTFLEEDLVFNFMVEKFGKSWVLLIFQVDLVTLLTENIVAHSFTRERLRGSALILCLIATKYFTAKT